jgi:hypothetical protein
VRQVCVKFDLDAYASFSLFPKMLAVAVAEDRLALGTPAMFKDPDELWNRIMHSKKCLGSCRRFFFMGKCMGFL